MKVKFSATPLVCICIKGKSLGEGYVRDDGGLVGRFLKWQFDNEVYSVRGGSSGGGQYVGYFDPEDADRIKEFLKAEGANEVKDAR